MAERGVRKRKEGGAEILMDLKIKYVADEIIVTTVNTRASQSQYFRGGLIQKKNKDENIHK